MAFTNANATASFLPDNTDQGVAVAFTPGSFVQYVFIEGSILKRLVPS